MTQITSPEREAFVGVSQLLRQKLWPWGRSKHYQLVAAGILPRPIKLGPRLSVYPASVVRAVQDDVMRGKFDAV
jgi:hypothetical protein